MTRKTLLSGLRLAALVLAASFAWASGARAQCCTADTVPGKPGDTLTARDQSGKQGQAKVTIKIQIAPMAAAAADGASNDNVPADSEFTEVEGGGTPLQGGFSDFTDELKFVDANLATIQKAIFKRIGISPCATDPEALKDRPGAQDFVDSSEVLQPGGTRTTFGYFIRFKYTRNDEISPTAKFLALFSYDRILVKAKGNQPLCATEFFLFKFSRPGTAQDLDLGLAIDAGGKRLAEVPIDLARVKNFLSAHPGDEPVKPGVAAKGSGCLECHGGPDDKHPIDKTPQHTLPGPWMRSP